MQSMNPQKDGTTTTTKKPKKGGMPEALRNLSKPLKNNKQNSQSAFPLPLELEEEPLFLLEEELFESEEFDKERAHSDSDEDFASYDVGAPPQACLAPSKKRPAEEAKRDKQIQVRGGTPPIVIPTNPPKKTGFAYFEPDSEPKKAVSTKQEISTPKISSSKQTFLAELRRVQIATPTLGDEDIETNTAIYGSSPQ